MAQEGSKLGKEIEGLKKRLQASKKRLKQTQVKAEDLSALIKSTRRTREEASEVQKSSNKKGK